MIRVERYEMRMCYVFEVVDKEIVVKDSFKPKLIRC